MVDQAHQGARNIESEGLTVESNLRRSEVGPHVPTYAAWTGGRAHVSPLRASGEPHRWRGHRHDDVICPHCHLAERTTAILDDGNGQIAPALLPLHQASCTLPSLDAGLVRGRVQPTRPVPVRPGHQSPAT